MVTGIGIIANISSLGLCKTPSHNILGIVYYTQILMLLPLMNIDIGEDVIDFFRYTEDLLFSFSFVPNNLVFASHDDIFNTFHYKQQNWYLYLLGLKSGSSISNSIDFMFVLTLICIIAIVVALIYTYAKHYEPDRNRFSFFKECKNLFLAGIWLQIICVSFIFMLMISLEEMQTSSKTNNNTASYFFSLFLYLICHLLLVFSIYKWWECRPYENLTDLCYTKTLFVGTKDYAPARCFISIWLFRRLFFCYLASPTNNIDKNILLPILITVQLIYLTYIIGIRPYKVFTDNFGEITNELFILICLIFCLIINKEKQWDRNHNRIFLILILIPNILFTCVSIIGLKKISLEKQFIKKADKRRDHRIIKFRDSAKERLDRMENIKTFMYYLQ